MKTPTPTRPDADADAVTVEQPNKSVSAESSETVTDTNKQIVNGNSGNNDVATAETATDTDVNADTDTDTDDTDTDSSSLASQEAAAVLDETAQSDNEPGRLKRAAAFATGKIVIEEDDLEGPLWQLEMALLESDVEMQVAEEILDTIQTKMLGETRAQVNTTAALVEEALSDALYEVISVGQYDFESRVENADSPVTIVFTGVNGVGKTTSIAKLVQYLESRGLSVVMANGDTYRAGANEQIREHAERLDTKIIAHEQGGDPAAVLYDAVEYAEANDIDVVLGDTAGRLHTSNDLMAQLEKIDRVVDPDMTLFVDEAVAGQDAVERAKQFNEAAEIDGAILTKADADSNGGAAISIAYVTGKPILFLGVGQEYDDIERFNPDSMVNQLLGETVSD
ncbi:MAG: signal recognition particle-docking protein FtsY [Haloquadratum walsbyi J07HQW2]|uniref:Signal recognition particle receptor FtsY n=1 Tax=Haloquadratum walsbyi J07HQW2 TaxID=1238425 RepID=U1NFP0_9EURY|nr:signal recognition particle-docking protein FtsY [Haloquadratum walsbyi]ERG95638.1 MAG: signal recognition particle-docking protein FtsY [Haloquadratum walsbyi J07HQW2]